MDADEVFSKYFNKVICKCRNKEQLNNKFTYENLYINLKDLDIVSNLKEKDYCNLVIAVKNIWNCIKDNI